MDKKKKVLIILLVFVLLLGGASVLYKQLGEKADTNQLASETENVTCLLYTSPSPRDS